jgi:hypothetical protein
MVHQAGGPSLKTRPQSFGVLAACDLAALASGGLLAERGARFLGQVRDAALSLCGLPPFLDVSSGCCGLFAGVHGFLPFLPLVLTTAFLLPGGIGWARW